MDTRRIGLVAAAITVASLLLGLGSELLLGRWVDAGAEPGILPMFGSVGTTVTAYTIIGEMVAVLMPIAFGLGLGVWLVRRTGEGDDLGRALRAVAGGSAVGVLLVAAIVLALVSVPASFAGAGLSLLLVLKHLVSTALLVSVAAAAGVTVERFGRGPETENHRTATADDATTAEAGVDDTQQGSSAS